MSCNCRECDDAQHAPLIASPARQPRVSSAKQSDTNSEQSTACVSDHGAQRLPRHQERKQYAADSSRRSAGVAERVVPLVDSESTRRFQMRGCVLGEGGENLRYITKETGARVSLLGRGMGRHGEAEQDGPPRLVLSGARPRALARAVTLAQELAVRVREKYDEAVGTTVDAGRDRNGHPKGECKGKGKGTDKGKLRMGSTVMERISAEAKRLHEEAQKKSDEAEQAKKQAADLRGEAARLSTRMNSTAADSVKAAGRAATLAAVKASSKRGDDSTAVSAWQAAEEYWKTLETAREKAHAANSVHGREWARLRCEAALLGKKAVELTQESKAKEKQAKASDVAAASPSSIVGRCCALFAAQACPFESGSCPRGSHEVPGVPTEQEVFMTITTAKRRLLQQKWSEAGGPGELHGAWQIRNPRLEFLFRGAEANFTEQHSQVPDVIDAWHGSGEENVFSIARSGFDPRRRSGQVYGAGEYFAKNPNVSIGYARGGSFMFLCKLLLGKEQEDHTWHHGPQYYVIKQREGRMQVLPIFLLQFKESKGALASRLASEVLLCDSVEQGTLATQQRGGERACEGRRGAGMSAKSTQHLWLGWLDPALRFRDDDGVAEDVRTFLQGYEVSQVVPERNGSRVGAFVLLKESIGQASFHELSQRRYHGECKISVDDAQPANPRCSGKLCPRLSGPSHYCRGWNIRGHVSWQWGCAYSHPEESRPTFTAEFSLEALRSGSAKYDEINTEVVRSLPQARVVGMHRVQNGVLEALYEQRRKFIYDKQGFAVEKELWHGTSCEALPTLLKHGLQPPADTEPSDSCPVSGRKGLCTTLCGTECVHCTKQHRWNRCHMYGLGVYLADVAAKSHQYVRMPKRDQAGRQVYSMLRCKVCLGNPYLVEGNLLQSAAMHDKCWCQDPSEALETLAEEWSTGKGHDAYYIKGQAGKQKHGLGVHNNEYVVFQPYQILPLYRVDYIVS